MSIPDPGLVPLSQSGPHAVSWKALADRAPVVFPRLLRIRKWPQQFSHRLAHSRSVPCTDAECSACFNMGLPRHAGRAQPCSSEHDHRRIEVRLARCCPMGSTASRPQIRRQGLIMLLDALEDPFPDAGTEIGSSLSCERVNKQETSLARQTCPGPRLEEGGGLHRGASSKMPRTHAHVHCRPYLQPAIVATIPPSISRNIVALTFWLEGWSADVVSAD